MEVTYIRLKDGRSAVIRQAVPDDAAAITEFVNIVGAEGRFVLRERATWTLDEERRTLAGADSRFSVFFVAEISGRLSGLINLSRGRWVKDAHLAEFGISCLPECRGIGLGKALLLRGMEWARSVGVRKLTLEVFSTNEPAIGLYRRMGFVEEARLQGQYMIDEQPVEGVLMAIWL
jgi:RimJ/RimL family protein N-acetyltransferase